MVVVSAITVGVAGVIIGVAVIGAAAVVVPEAGVTVLIGTAIGAGATGVVAIAGTTVEVPVRRLNSRPNSPRRVLVVESLVTV